MLVVDDDALTLEMYARVLRLDGYRVETSRRADAALQAIDVTVPDAIILDLRMPDVDGVEFLRRVRARGDSKTTPVAVVTGDYSLEAANSSELRKLDARVRFKPLWVEDLFTLIHDMVGPPR